MDLIILMILLELQASTKNRTYLYATSNVSGTAGQGSTVTSSNANSLIAFDSEL
jgi:hypothetical protein